MRDFDSRRFVARYEYVHKKESYPMGAYHNDGCYCDKCRIWRRSSQRYRRVIIKRHYTPRKRRAPKKMKGWFW